MIRTVEAVVDQSGSVRLLEDVRLSEARRALVTMLEEPPIASSETALPSEAALLDWNRPEEETVMIELTERQMQALENPEATRRAS